MCPICVAPVEKLQPELSQLSYSCIGQVSTMSLRRCMSQSEMWLLIYVILTQLEKNRSAVSELASYFAFSLSNQQVHVRLI